MSLIICVHVEEGIVLASDSRASFNKQIIKPEAAEWLTKKELKG